MSVLHPLDRKLWRDLLRLRGQVLAIALVIGSGVGVQVMALSAQDALKSTTEAYYERYRFADVFATLNRAPERVARRIADIDGVQTVETRIVETALLDIPGLREPAVALLSSVPEGEQPALNRLVLTAGRFVRRDGPDEAVVNAPFAEAHGFRPGSTFHAVINGRRRMLTVVGIALSPEHAYAIGPGMLMPDDRRYGVVWMGREALAAAFDRKDAFNEVSLALLPGVNPEAVIARLDRTLAPFGGHDAIARADQLSNWFLMNEIDELGVMAVILPSVFLLVAAFLTNMVVGRLIATERSYIGLLKAFGYGTGEIAWHYAKIVLAMAMAGVVLGWAVGAALGRYNTSIYAEHFSLPFLLFRPHAYSFAVSAAVSLGAALLGGAFAVRAAVRLPPAEAMRPPAPPSYAQGALSDTRFARMLDQPSRMIVRNTVRWPLRAAVTVVGLAMAIAVLTSSLQWLDAIHRMIDTHFFATQRQDASVTFNEARSSTVVEDVAALPGVRAVEPERTLGVVLRHGPRKKRTGLVGRVSEPHLDLVYDVEGGPVPIIGDGLVLSTKLARLLDLRVGDTATVDVLEGRRPVVDLPVTAVFETYIGIPAYMRLGAMNRLMGERESVDTVHVSLDTAREDAFFAALKRTPAVSAVYLRRAAVDIFNETLGRTLLIFIGFFSGFSFALAIGVTYNAMRIALSERARELATLRVLGLTRTQIGYILLGQSALLVLLALPVGCLAGWALAAVMTRTFDTELFRVPMVIAPATYGWAMLLALAAATLSSLIIARRLGRLDLIAVLKTRE